MGYRPEKKSQKKKQSTAVPLDGARKFWAQKKPVLFFVGGFALLMVLFYVVILSEAFQEHIQVRIMAVYAVISNFILNLFGADTIASSQVITSPRFTVSIARGCDALEAMALFTAAMLTFPARWKHKLIGLGGGLAALFVLNVVRIVSLYLTGLWFPKAFEFMHVEVWQVIFILVAIGLWIFWIRWTGKERAGNEK